MGNVIAEKSKLFALRIIKLYQYLVKDKKEFILSKQILRSGTSIGANVREAVVSMSRKEFISKMNISLKESEETLYWLELLYESGTINNEGYGSIYPECLELKKILISIIKKTRKNMTSI